MGVQWTEEQREVIDVRGKNILVSAAAGSGKTAVLVERIIERLTKEEPPLDVDRLLVVTYTEAAAAEMKERIRDAIEKALEEHPDDVHLQRQATLVHHAQVTTIHSFCLSVIRENFHTIGLDPGFRIAEEGEMKLLKQDVAAELLEQKYEEGKKAFLELTEYTAPGRDDHKLTELLLKIYDFSRSYPNPCEWLYSCAAHYKIEDGIEEQPFFHFVQEQTIQYAKDMLELTEYAIELCEEPDGPVFYLEALAQDEALIRQLAGAKSYETIYEILAEWKWAKLSAKRSDEIDPDKRELVKQVREDVKTLQKDLKEQYFYEPLQEIEEHMRQCAPMMETFVELTADFHEAMQKEKAKRNMIDFGDMEHFALEILTEQKDGKRCPSQAARSYQERFEEIMIDEYQDSNLIQEALLTSVSRKEQGIYNIFMVGDVKQSIYRFRLARPELFMEKYHTYGAGEGQCQRIDLTRNFRSRREVLESTNFIFRQIMTEGFGGIAYDERAALYPGASYENIPGNEAELLLIDTSVQEGVEEETVRELEAHGIARRIKELVGVHPVLDKRTGTYRPAGYGDIVILTRSLKGWTEEFSRILNQEGIPTFAGTKEGYFETWEVSTVLDYLELLDNFRQDLPLTSVLLSPFGNVTAEELARIRVREMKTEEEGASAPFFRAVVTFMKEAEEKDSALQQKLRAFQKQYESYREILSYTSIYDLMWKLLHETGYRDYVGAMPGGRQRQANLDMLLEKALAFEKTSYKGLFHFVRYIRQLKKYDVDYGEANIADEQTDTVRLMSIHKSKGLEFPIVFVSGMGKQFNTQDIREQFVVHPSLGIGTDCIDLEMRTKAPTLLKKVIQKETALENLAEEERVLYVALTRAKEKLIITGAVNGVEEKLKSFGAVGAREETELSFASVSRARTYLDWIIPALIRNKAFDIALSEAGLPVPFMNSMYHQDVPIRVEVIYAAQLAEKAEEEFCADQLLHQFLKEGAVEKEVFHPEMKEHLQEQFSFVYPFSKDRTRKMKFTVSELKKTGMEKELAEESEVVFAPAKETKLIPAFRRGEEELTGASRGTAYHRVLERIDFREEYNEEKIKDAIAALVREGKLEAAEAKTVSCSDLMKFFESRLAVDMKEAARQGKLFREQPFVIGIEDSGEWCLVQGIIDAYLEEPDGSLAVIDYKTDRVKRKEELQERYRRQLEYYAQALEQLLGKKVKRKIIYSFTLQTEIEV